MVRTVHLGDARTVVSGGFAALCDVISYCIRSHTVKIFPFVFPQQTLAHEYDACIFFLPSTSVLKFLSPMQLAVNFSWRVVRSTRSFALAKFAILTRYMTAGNFRSHRSPGARTGASAVPICYLLLARHVATQPCRRLLRAPVSLCVAISPTHVGSIDGDAIGRKRKSLPAVVVGSLDLPAAPDRRLLLRGCREQ